MVIEYKNIKKLRLSPFQDIHRKRMCGHVFCGRICSTCGKQKPKHWKHWIEIKWSNGWFNLLIKKHVSIFAFDNLSNTCNMDFILFVTQTKGQIKTCHCNDHCLNCVRVDFIWKSWIKWKSFFYWLPSYSVWLHITFWSYIFTQSLNCSRFTQWSKLSQPFWLCLLVSYAFICSILFSICKHATNKIWL